MILNLKLTPRTYCLVPRHLSAIQAGIQCSHAASLFAHHHADLNSWCVTKDQTLILLEVNSLNEIDNLHQQLLTLSVPCVVFKEPDLGDLTTALYFVLDEEFYTNKIFMKINYLERYEIDNLNELVENLNKLKLKS